MKACFEWSEQPFGLHSVKYTRRDTFNNVIAIIFYDALLRNYSVRVYANNTVWEQVANLPDAKNRVDQILKDLNYKFITDKHKSFI